MLETKVALRHRTGLNNEIRNNIQDLFLRRDYDEVLVYSIQLTGGVKERVQLPTSDIKYLGLFSDGTKIQVYKNLSPESWSFTDVFLIFEADGCKSVVLNAEEDTEVLVAMAG